MEQRRWLLLALALLAAIPLSGNFDVTSPQNVIGTVGQDTILPCTISSTKPLNNPQVQWVKITDGHTENIYTHRQSGGEPMQKYRGRASVPGDGLATRNVSLTLKNVQPADEGMYNCIVISTDWGDGTSTKLSIAGTGEVFIEVLGPQGQGLELGCRSQGWFPKPTVQWVTEDGQGLSADTEIHQDSEKLFSVWSRVTGEQVGKVTCQILNPLLQVEKKTTVHISGAAFPHVSPFVHAFWIVFLLFLLTLAAVVVPAFRGRRVESNTPEVLEYMLQKEIQHWEISRKIQTLHMQEFSQWNPNSEPGPTKRLISKGTQEENITESLEEIVTEDFKSMYPRRKNKEKKSEFSQVQSYKEFVTLDADTAHPRLEISADGRRVKDSGVISDVPSSEKRFDSHLFVLAKEGFTSGKHYWEVCVGLRKRNWALGIALESVTRKGPLTLSPKNGFWAIGLADGQDYWAYTDRWTRLRVSGELQFTGIFLDIPAKQVTFYDALKEAALYTFSIADGSSQEGKLIPFFSLGPATAEPDPEPLVIYG